MSIGIFRDATKGASSLASIFILFAKRPASVKPASRDCKSDERANVIERSIEILGSPTAIAVRTTRTQRSITVWARLVIGRNIGSLTFNVDLLTRISRHSIRLCVYKGGHFPSL